MEDCEIVINICLYLHAFCIHRTCHWLILNKASNIKLLCVKVNG